MTLQEIKNMDLIKAELESHEAEVEMIANVVWQPECQYCGHSDADVDFTILAEFPNGEKWEIVEII